LKYYTTVKVPEMISNARLMIKKINKKKIELLDASSMELYLHISLTKVELSSTEKIIYQS